MRNLFDSEKLEATLKDYFKVTNIRIAILDTSYKDIGGYPKRRSSLCEYIRTNKKADSLCRECDHRACSIVKDTMNSYLYQCHAGLYESIVPLQVNGLLVGYLFFAHMVSGSSHADCYKKISQRTKRFGLDETKIKSLVYQSPLLTIDYIKAATRLLETIAIHLCMQKMGFFKKTDDLPILINKYIGDNLTNSLTISDICGSIGIGKTKLSQISKRYFNIGIHGHIRELRINKAKEILISEPDTRIDDVCQRCGFENYNYFISIFKETVGMTPKKFQLSNNAETDR
ncbi:MAG: PocR ligand-binding domain-containing protein [Bacilli bacterium]|jgi:AraC-like DNA-binding protein|nr:PocR ligand-binding domain-containing protein [Bacilli bacterium]